MVYLAASWLNSPLKTGHISPVEQPLNVSVRHRHCDRAIDAFPGLASRLARILHFNHTVECEYSGERTMRRKRAAMTYPIRFWALLLIALMIYQVSANASADYCKYEKIINETLDLSNSELLSITAVAGDLDIVGISGSDQAAIHARVCAAKESWLEQSEIIMTAGKNAAIEVSLPDTGSSWFSMGNNYLGMDLKIEVPQNLPLDVRDSSGDILLKDLTALQIHDSSGDIEAENVTGPLGIRDSSGDITIDGATGDITIESDSSGDIEIMEIDGNVLVMSDSSGDIEVTGVTGDFVVERDSSGDISAESIGGDYRVLRDGSGEITSRDVKGTIEIPDKD